jgi:hypothetical protein
MHHHLGFSNPDLSAHQRILSMMNNIPNRDNKAVTEKLWQGFEDPEKMKELASDLRQRKHSNRRIQLIGSARKSGIMGVTKRALEEDQDNQRAGTDKQRTQENEMAARHQRSRTAGHPRRRRIKMIAGQSLSI